MMQMSLFLMDAEVLSLIDMFSGYILHNYYISNRVQLYEALASKLSKLRNNSVLFGTLYQNLRLCLSVLTFQVMSRGAHRTYQSIRPITNKSAERSSLSILALQVIH